MPAPDSNFAKFLAFVQSTRRDVSEVDKDSSSESSDSIDGSDDDSTPERKIHAEDYAWFEDFATSFTFEENNSADDGDGIKVPFDFWIYPELIRDVSAANIENIDEVRTIFKEKLNKLKSEWKEKVEAGTPHTIPARYSEDGTQITAEHYDIDGAVKYYEKLIDLIDPNGPKILLIFIILCGTPRHLGGRSFENGGTFNSAGFEFIGDCKSVIAGVNIEGAFSKLVRFSASTRVGLFTRSVSMLGSVH